MANVLNLFRCHTCQMRFSDERFFNMHRDLHMCEPDWSPDDQSTIETHDSEAEIPIHCCHCGKTFLMHEQLYHIHTILICQKTQAEIVNQKCYVCDQDFCCKFGLEHHAKLHHVTMYSCEFCEETFASKQEFGIHRNMHLVEHGQTIESPPPTPRKDFASEEHSPAGELFHQRQEMGLKLPIKHQKVTPSCMLHNGED